MKNPQIIFLIIVVAFGLIMGGYLLNPSSTPSSANPANSQEPSAPADPALLHNDQSPVIGKSDAKIKLVVFSDYLCPYCKTAHDVINKVIEKYPNDVSVEVRNFVVHEEARIHAQASIAAHKQGKFKEMNDALFAETIEGTEDAVKAIAKKIKLNENSFSKDLNSEETKSRITKDEDDARALMLQGTPSIFMNNKAVDNFNNLESMIAAELGK